MIRFIPLILFVLLGVLLYRGLFLNPQAMPSALIGKPMPDFTLNTLLDPEKHVTKADLQGNIVLLNVWATWCPSCQHEHSYLNELSQKGVNIIGLNYKDEREAALTWLKNLGNPYELTIYDPHGKLGFDLGVYGAPETYLVDQYGVVRYRHVGIIDDKIWNKTLKPLIEKYSPTTVKVQPKQ